MSIRKEKQKHLDFPRKLKRVKGDKKVNVTKFLDDLSKLFIAVDGMRFTDNSQGSIRLSDDGALELSINLPGTQYQGEYRNDGVVVIGGHRQAADYQFTDVINYRYDKEGQIIQEYDHWEEADSLDVGEFEYVYYEFKLLDEPDDEGNNVEAVLKSSSDFPVNNEEDPDIRIVVLGRTGLQGVWYQFHQGEIELDFTKGGGSSFSFIQITDVDYSANNGDPGNPSYIYKAMPVDSIEASVVVPPTDPEELTAFEESKVDVKIINGYPWNLEVGDNIIQIGSFGAVALANNDISPDPVVKIEGGAVKVFNKEIGGIALNTISHYRIMSAPAITLSLYNDTFPLAQWSKKDERVRIYLPVI